MKLNQKEAINGAIISGVVSGRIPSISAKDFQGTETDIANGVVLAALMVLLAMKSEEDVRVTLERLIVQAQNLNGVN